MMDGVIFFTLIEIIEHDVYLRLLLNGKIFPFFPPKSTGVFQVFIGWSCLAKIFTERAGNH